MVHESPSEDAFWAHYSDKNGKRMNYQKILDTFKDERKADDETDAATALRFFKNDLSDPRARKYLDTRSKATHTSVRRHRL